MTAKMTRFTSVGVSFVSLLLSFGHAPVLAQVAPPAPAIVLPPLPDVEVKVSAPAQTAAAPVTPTIAAMPAQAVVADPPPPSPAKEIAAPATEPAKPAVAVANVDQALRSTLEASVREILPRALATQKQLREQILAVYAQRNFAPLWLAAGDWTPAARGAIARLGKAAEDGLDIKATPAPAGPGADEKSLVAAELALTQAVVAYGQQASGSRINPRSVGHLITEKPEVATPDRILTSVASAPDADAALAAFNPMHVGYRALRAKLAEMRGEKAAEPVRIAGGPTLRLGMKDVRVPSLRARFKIDTATDIDELTYDVRIAAAVTEFQRGKGLPSSGQLNPATIAALSQGDPARIESEIVANMERWRWLPRAEAADRIEVNIPDYTVRITRAGALVHTARVVVGKPDTPTPVFSNRMQFLEVNPYWNVPESIIKNEMMPRLAQDPTYLQRQGYEVTTNRKGEMVVRQPPGNRNALGFIKFMFPNEHAVYLHDTPSRALFNTARRAYSHGCVRVDMPFKFAEIVLGKENGWSEERVKKLIGTGNRTIQLPKHIDVHIEYFTAFVDEAGKLQLRDDIYGYSRRLKAAMGLTV